MLCRPAHHMPGRAHPGDPPPSAALRPSRDITDGSASPVCIAPCALCPCARLDPTAADAGPQDFERVKLIGQGDVGKVYLVRLKDSTNYFAMKVLSKQEMIARNKVGAPAGRARPADPPSTMRHLPPTCSPAVLCHARPCSFPLHRHHARFAALR